MSDSEAFVINFDEVAKKHNRERAYPDRLKSCDAFYVANDDQCYFIEFKTGNIKGSDEKARASLLIAMDLNIVHDLRDSQTRFTYILVYSEVKYPNEPEHLTEMFNDLNNDANPQLSPSHICRNLKWLFHQAIPYTAEQFEEEFIKKIVSPIEASL